MWNILLTDVFTKKGLSILATTMVYAIVGIVVFIIVFWLVDRITPFNINKEIEEDQNIAVAIVVAGFLIGIAIIMAASIAG